MIKTILSATGEPIFHLTAGDASYVFSIFHGFPLHLYAGPAISDDDVEYLLVRVGHDSVVPRPAHTPEGCSPATSRRLNIPPTVPATSARPRSWQKC